MRLKKGVLGLALSLLVLASAGGCASNPSARDDGMNVAGGDASGSGGAPVTEAGGSSGSGATLGGSSNGAAGNSGGTSAGGVGGTGGTGGGAPTSRPKIRTVAYLPSYRGSLATWATQLDFSLVSYVNVCFGVVDPSGNVSYDATLPSFVSAAHAAGAKVCLAFGGGTANDSLTALTAQITAGNRAGFVNKITSYAMTNNLDCIDVDLEGDWVNQDYEGFVTALGSALKAQNKQMSAAVGSWFGQKITDNALHAFDFVNVMAYDLHNPYGTATPVQSSSLAESKTEVDYWVGRGLSKDKAVFGVPFYAFRWKSGATAPEVLTYAAVLSSYGAAAGNDEIMQDGATVFLNSRATIVAKAQLAAQYGGIMAWEIGQDATTPATSLLRAIHDAP